MKHKHPKKQLLALFLVLSLVLQLAGGSMASAATPAESTTVTLTQTTAEAVSVTLTDETQEAETADAEAATQSEYADTDVVRVSIVLEEASTIAVGFDTIDIAQNTEAMAYRESLKETQAEMEAIISAQVLDGEELDVVWNLTLAANLISANVEYGQIEAIAALDGVEAVYIEPIYEAVETGDDNDAEITTITSGTMTGTTLAWSEGYTGAGTRIAVIDTGTDTDHQSFDAGAFEYSLMVNAAQAVAEGKFDTVEEYIESLNLLDAEEIASVLTSLNAYSRNSTVLSAEDLYLNSKLAFAYNYVDSSLDVTHDNDAQGEHGSHVAGIATANAYIPTDTGYTTAIDSVYVTGQAPDAQLITMKVFGSSGGAYASDYMAAIEDAIILGCDAVNLSLGSSTTGFTYSGTEYYDSLMDSLQNTNTVVVVAAGNSYSWSSYANNDASLLYTGDVSDSRIASPATYTNALAVASVDNTGFTGSASTFEGEGGTYSGGVTESGTTPSGYQVWTTLDTTGEGTEYEYVFLGDPSYLLDDEYEGDDAGDYKGYESDFEGLDLTGKIVLISRGTISFYVKHDNAALAGAAGVIIYNNVDGSITMDISSSGSTIPCVSITLAAAKAIFAASTVAEDGTRSGTVTVNAEVSIIFGETDADISMSSYSSWGATESLTIKPEITAPGGSIYSVDGSSEDTTAYESMNGTSMASPQIAGISAVLKQYITENNLEELTGLSYRTLAQSLMMSTAVPVIDADTGLEYSVRRQGAGLVNVGNAVSAETVVLVGDTEDNDGKVKAELGDDPEQTGVYTFDFTLYNLTDSVQTYTLDTSILSPAVVEYDGVTYMDQSNYALNPTVTFTTSGDPDASLFYDFDGDGDVDVDDAQALIDYIAGNREEISNRSYADLSGNGAVDTYDVHLLLQYINDGSNAADWESDGTITVPANGEVTVTVTITLSDSDREYIETNFENGTYVEGFVYVNSVSDSEGVVGVSHSIPMLAFYGSWSDASMYDTGDYTSDYYGESLTHYVKTSGYANYMTTKIGKTSYYYGLNLYVVDEEYLPERASMSSVSGSSIAKIYYTLIRNSAQGKVIITDDETGEVYYESSVGQQYSAYYYVSGSAWYNTQYSAIVNWKGTDANGNALADGTRVTISLITASEYYRDEDGNIDWDALSDGAYYSMPVLIDNVAPTVESADYDEDSDSIVVSVTDNHYTAAVLLLNASGSAVLSRQSVNQTEEGVTRTVSISLDGQIGTQFVLAVVDYAGNTNYYNLTIDKVSSSGKFYGFQTDYNGWVNFGTDVNANETVLTATDVTFACGDYAEGYLFAVTSSGDLYAVSVEDASETMFIKSLYYTYVDLAYDSGTGVLYGLRNYSNGKSYLYSIDLTTGAERYLSTVSGNLKSLACDGNGTFYALSNAGQLVSFTLEDTSLTSIGSLGKTLSKAQSTTYCTDTGSLYWVNGTSLVEISVTDATTTTVGELSGSMTCLCYETESTGAFGKVETVTGITISGETEVFVGCTATLSVTVRPWNTTNTSVIWSSSDEAIATVSADGVVTGVAAGTVTITATSAAYPEVSGSIAITVNSLALMVYGAAVSNEGVPSLYERNLFTGEITYSAIGGMNSLLSGTLDASSDAIWLMDESGTLYQIDSETNTVVQSVASASGLAVYDMAYSKRFGGFSSVYNAYLLVPTGFEDNSPNSGFDFANYLASYTGATAFVAITSAGNATYSGYSCDLILALDNAGYLWLVYLYANGSSYGAYMGYGATGLAGLIESDTCNSMAYVASYGSSGGILVSLCTEDDGTAQYMIDLSDFTAESLGNASGAVAPAVVYSSEAVTESGSESAAEIGTIAFDSITMIEESILAIELQLS